MSQLLRIAALATTVLASGFSAAQGTPAGTIIQNRASAEFTTNGKQQTVLSEPAAVTVQELIDVTLEANAPTFSVSPNSDNQVMSFKVKNTGNGVEVFSLDASNSTGDDFDATDIRIYEDVNGDGKLDNGDKLISGQNPTLSIDGNSSNTERHILVVANIPDSLSPDNRANIELTVRSTTEGAADAEPGDVLAGKGTGGAADAVAGNHPRNSASSAFVILTPDSAANVVIQKSVETILDPFGNQTVIPGTRLTYRIVAEVVGNDINNLIITDAIPSELDYVAESGSLTLPGTSTPIDFSDADDNDQGKFENNILSINIGDASVGETFTIHLTTTVK